MSIECFSSDKMNHFEVTVSKDMTDRALLIQVSIVEKVPELIVELGVNRAIGIG